MFVITAAIANLFGIGGASVISRALGEGNRKKARETFAACFWFGLLGAVVYMVIIILFRSRIIYLVGGDENDFQYVSSYMFWTMIAGAIPTVGNVLCGHLVRSIGASKEAGIGMSMGGILNIILDPIFMFVILPEGMEVTGAAMATLISNTCMGMTMGVLPLLGYSFGAKNISRMRSIIRYTGTVVVLFGSFCTAVFVIAAPELIRFFINESGSIEYGTEFLRIIGFAAPMAAFSYLAYTVFQSAGMEKSAFTLSIMRKGVLDIPGMFIFRVFMGAKGVCLATPVAEVLSVFIGLFLYMSFRRRITEMDVEAGDDALREMEEGSEKDL